MKSLFLFQMILSSVWVFAQTEDELIQEITDFQQELNEDYLDKETSPLSRKDRKHFQGHRFYEINLNYRVIAQVELLEKQDTIVMPTSAGTEKVYVKYARLHFEIDGTECELVAYQSTRESLKNYLFIPFRDKTSGNDSYGGGRYIEMPIGDEVVLNFNLAYNPYCAYADGWYCPIPPEENTLQVAIKAGLMVPLEH